MLRRYLRMKKKEVKLQLSQNKQFNQDEGNDNSIIIGCQDLTTQNTLNNTTFKTRELSEISQGRNDSTISKVKWMKHKIKKVKQEIKPRLLKRMMGHDKEESDTDSFVEYDGRVYRELEDIKETINFNIDKLKEQYSGE